MVNIINIHDSVRGIVEFVLRRGNLDDRYMGKNRALEGTLAHQKLQSSNAAIYKNYQKEVKLEKEFYIDDIILKVDGRADGIITENGLIYIEEIKSTFKSLLFIEEDYNELHWAQAKFYAYIYAEKNVLSSIWVRLSYYNIETDEVKSFDKLYDLKELEMFVYNIINEYSKWIKLKGSLNKDRNISIEKLKFPFDTYRKGQRELAINCYKTIKQKGVLFAQAPTGIGKTISTVYPSIKALGEGRGNRIIYLTAKTITRTVAEEAFNKLKSNGLKCRTITLTSKEKICFKDKVKCNPDDCEYAVDYFGKANDVVFEVIKNEISISRQIIEKYSKKFKVCPFELSLDLSVWCDAIICDYNYAFDPRVRLKRIFEDNTDENIILVDEGHNLVSRAREMFSAEIYKSKILLVSKLVKGTVPSLYKSLYAINKELANIRSELQGLEKSTIYHKYEYKELYRLLKIALKEGDEYLVKATGTAAYEDVLDLYFDIKSFLAVAEIYSDEYVTLVESDKNELKIKLFCVNPSKNLATIVRESYSTIIFSATLTPLKYYIDLLGGNEESYRMTLSSPFNKENFKTYGYPLNMRYRERDKNIEKVCILINRFINDIRGNYMVFLPSYEYLNKVYEKYIEIYDDENVICQREILTEEERETFIDKFKIDCRVTAFCVIGGIFSEGIDLVGERLIGSIIVGVGFPRISKEGDIIKDYYGDNGFDYAYIYPGINKVLQAAGRVIRREEDKGRLLLIDDRYFTTKYRELLPKEWDIYKY